MAESATGKHPPYRRLRVYGFDPTLSTSLDTAGLNEVTLKVAWEPGLRPGPVGECLEVVDCDAASKCFYGPVDLTRGDLLATDGLTPSEANPQFHQQMVYAVAMETIRKFEGALGRFVLWAPHRTRTGGGREEFVRRLRIYPHGLREANAYYSPEKKALLFGYARAWGEDVGSNLPGGVIFACLSHDIIAHETTHALVDGLRRRFVEPSNPDVLAFHEALADIVAIFQHFSMPEVLQDQIAATRGDLGLENLLAKLAQQFGQALGRGGALRDALGHQDAATGRWERDRPDPARLRKALEPHDRGAVLVAAVFGAFVRIYNARVADLIRIATHGTGVLPAGRIHPDLVVRLAREASKCADHVLRMCIRALDYSPPVDITFGDFLRALVTADFDVAPADERNYRLAFVDSFRSWGVYPLDALSLSPESLRWNQPSEVEAEWYRNVLADRDIGALVTAWQMRSDRRWAYEQSRAGARTLHDWIAGPGVRRWAGSARGRRLQDQFGLALGRDAPPTVWRGRDGWPAIEVHSVRPAFRLDLRGQPVTDLVIEITQRRRGYLDPGVQNQADHGSRGPLSQPDFVFRGGCTLLVNLDTGDVRYAVSKRITSESRLERHRSMLTGAGLPSGMRGLASSIALRAEPFAMLHRRRKGGDQWQDG